MKHYVVTAAILTHNHEILCMQRGQSKFDYISHKYEFPGGKVEQGESLEDCLARELQEEMKIQVDVQVEQFFCTVTHEYPDFTITMHSYICPVRSKEFQLTEHINYQWLTRDKLFQLDWAAADLPIVKKLIEG